MLKKKDNNIVKPDVIRKNIEKMFPSQKKIELFARDKFTNWEVWGLDALKSF
jgi:N6-adenosine-specific RNA methylase IME4